MPWSDRNIFGVTVSAAKVNRVLLSMVVLLNLVILPIMMLFVQFSIVWLSLLDVNGRKLPHDGGWMIGVSISISLFMISFSNIAVCYFLSVIFRNPTVEVIARRSVHVAVWTFTLAVLIWPLRWL